MHDDVNIGFDGTVEAGYGRMCKGTGTWARAGASTTYVSRDGLMGWAREFECPRGW